MTSKKIALILLLSLSLFAITARAEPTIAPNIPFQIVIQNVHFKDGTLSFDAIFKNDSPYLVIINEEAIRKPDIDVFVETSPTGGKYFEKDFNPTTPSSGGLLRGFVSYVSIPPSKSYAMSVSLPGALCVDVNQYPGKPIRFSMSFLRVIHSSSDPKYSQSIMRTHFYSKFFSLDDIR